MVLEGVILMRLISEGVNLYLLGLILIMLVVFVSFSVYYQNYIMEMQKEYDKKLLNLMEIEKELQLKENELNEIFELKNSIKKDKEILEMGYLNLQSENNNLQKLKLSITEYSDVKPFAKTLCKITGNAQCIN